LFGEVDGVPTRIPGGKKRGQRKSSGKTLPQKKGWSVFKKKKKEQKGGESLQQDRRGKLTKREPKKRTRSRQPPKMWESLTITKLTRTEEKGKKGEVDKGRNTGQKGKHMPVRN